MVKSRNIFGVALVINLLILGNIGCSNFSGSSFSGSQVRSVHTVERGTVVSVHHVELREDSPAIAGTIGGGILGGIVGSVFGGGTGRILATAVGAGAGALAGNVAQKAITKQKGLEIEVKLDNGQDISIVQGADEMFSVGERVRVLRASDGSARVAR